MFTLDQIRRIIVSNTHRPFGIRELANELGISESYLRDICYQNFQMNPGMIIETVRLEMAIKLLSNNQLKIYEICRSVGYQNLKTFRNAFKRRLNMTPQAFRQNNK